MYWNFQTKRKKHGYVQTIEEEEKRDFFLFHLVRKKNNNTKLGI